MKFDRYSITILVVIIIAMAGMFFLGWKVRERYMEDRTMVYQTIGPNKNFDKEYKKDGMNCIDSYEVVVSFCSAYPVKIEHKD